MEYQELTIFNDVDICGLFEQDGLSSQHPPLEQLLVALQRCTDRLHTVGFSCCTARCTERFMPFGVSRFLGFSISVFPVFICLWPWLSIHVDLPVILQLLFQYKGHSRAYVLAPALYLSLSLSEACMCPFANLQLNQPLEGDTKACETSAK